MAEQAQKEPTMEEILSSIRKIIADDEPVRAEAQKPRLQPTVPIGDASDDDMFGDLDLSDEDEYTEELPTHEDEVMAAISESLQDVTEVVEDEASDFETDFEPLAETESHNEFDEWTTEFEEDDTGVEVLDDVKAASFDEVDDYEFESTVAEPEYVSEPSSPEPVKEVVMSRSVPLTDTKTVETAAGSLGKLLSKVDFGADSGSSNTIEGVVKDLLRPMLKEWLDENLPAIVDKHVEAEVQRIARMAR